MNKESETALALILQSLQTDLSASQHLTIDPSINWPLFYRMMIRHRVWHQIRNSLFSVKQNASISIVEKIDQYCKRDKLRILKTAAETARIARSLNQDGIQYCFVKGTILNILIYGALVTRPCRDIDLWVDPSGYQAAITNLIALGYQQKTPCYELKGFKERYYMNHKHDIAFYHSELNILVELHFKLGQIGLQFFSPTPPMCKLVTVFNTPVLTLEDDHHLLYLMIHGATHAWIRLRWLNDIALFIKSNRCDLDHVMALAKQIHCEHIVKQSLILVHSLLSVNDDVLCRLIQNPDRRVARLVVLSKQFIKADYVMTDGMSNPLMFIKYRYYLARVAVKRQKVSAVLSDTFKIESLFNNITLPDKLSFIYYLIYFGWVIKFFWRSKGPR